MRRKTLPRKQTADTFAGKAVCFILPLIMTAAHCRFFGNPNTDLFTVTAEAASAPYMKITCIDLGSSSKVSGDAVLLESAKKFLLMDTGSKDPQNNVIKYLKSNGVRYLSLYISHFHEDHCDNAVSILTDPYFHVSRVYLANPDPARKYITSWNKSHRRQLYEGCRKYVARYNQINAAARKKHIAVTALRRGKSFSIGSVRAKVLWDHNTRGFSSFDPYD